MKKTEKKSFRDMMHRLEEITTLLESDKIQLEDSISLYEEGIEISAVCLSSLKDAELKITELKNRLTEISKDNPEN